MILAILSIGVVVPLLVQVTPEPQPTLSPNQIFRRAIRHLQSLPQPEFIDQITEWQESGPRGRHRSKERILWDSRNRQECVIGGTERATPSIIGESYFAPDSWLLTLGEGKRNARYVADPDPSDLKLIGSVTAAATPFYNVRLVGIDRTTKGGAAYHLRLDPLSDPMRHNLRELWINTETDNIMTAVLLGNYALDPTGGLPDLTPRRLQKTRLVG